MNTTPRNLPDLEKGASSNEPVNSSQNAQPGTHVQPDIIVDDRASLGSTTFSPTDQDFIDAFAIDFGKDGSLSVQEAQAPFCERNGESWPKFCEQNLPGLRVVLMNSLSISGESLVPETPMIQRSTSLGEAHSPRIGASPVAIRRRPSSIRTQRSLSVNSTSSRPENLTPGLGGQQASLSPRLGTKKSNASLRKLHPLQTNNSRDHSPFPDVPRTPIINSPLNPPRILEPGKGGLEPHQAWDSSLFLNVNEVASRGLNIWGIRNLWSAQPSPEPLWMSIPVHKNDLPEEADLSRELFKAFDVLHFDASGMRVPYLQIPARINVDYPHGPGRQVVCEFPIPELFSSVRELQEEPVQVPFKACFQTLLLSTSSATSLLHHNDSLAIYFTTLDLLRSALECWVRFLAQLSQDSSWTGDNRKTTNSDIFTHDNNMLQLKAFSSTIEDLSQAAHYTMDSIALGLDGKHQRQDRDSPHFRLEEIRLEVRAKLSTLQALSAELVSREERISETIRSLAAQSEANSLQGVTALAAIFLPLTLASSLLGMDRRARSLGMIWYDFVGLALLMGVPLFIVFSVISTAQNVSTKTGKQSIKTMLSLTATKFKIRFDRRKAEAENRKLVANGKITADEARRRSRKDIAERLASHDRFPGKHTLKPSISVLLHGFTLLAIASFLIGMFHSQDLGLRVLGYGAAATVGAVILAFALWALLSGLSNALFFVLKCLLVSSVMVLLLFSEYFGFRSAALPKARELASQVWRVEALGLLVLLGLGESAWSGEEASDASLPDE